MFFFFKQNTAYEMRISDWSSDVCSSVLASFRPRWCARSRAWAGMSPRSCLRPWTRRCRPSGSGSTHEYPLPTTRPGEHHEKLLHEHPDSHTASPACCLFRSEEHTSELQALMRLSYAVFCLKKKNTEDR